MKKVFARPHFDPTLLSFLTLHERRLEESTIRSSSRNYLDLVTLGKTQEWALTMVLQEFNIASLNGYNLGPKLMT